MGKEGPMIHSGAIVGAGLPQVQTNKRFYMSDFIDQPKCQCFFSILTISSHMAVLLGMH